MFTFAYRAGEEDEGGGGEEGRRADEEAAAGEAGEGEGQVREQLQEPYLYLLGWGDLGFEHSTVFPNFAWADGQIKMAATV